MTADGQGPLWLAIAPSGRFLYSAHTQATLLTVKALPSVHLPGKPAGLAVVSRPPRRP